MQRRSMRCARSSDHAGAGRRQGLGTRRPIRRGTFIKMVHNGIEYGLMQAYAEGFAITAAQDGFRIRPAPGRRDLAHTAASCARGCSTSPPMRCSKNPTLDGIAPYVADSGEGRWTVAEAIDARRARAGDHAVAAGAPALARRRFVRRQAAGGDAQRVRRPRGEKRRSRLKRSSCFYRAELAPLL